MLRVILAPLVLLQALLGARVIARLVRTAGGEMIRPVERGAIIEDRASVIVPVLNERERLRPCLDGLIAQGDEAREILIVDGGSTDGTQALVRDYAARDRRLRLVDASPIPDDWNGKVWGLQAGLEQADPANPWILTIDADVRPTAALTSSLLAYARATGLTALSVATRQEIEGPGEGVVHPALLTTLVYRFGIPGGRYRRVADVQANGQCFLVRRATLDRVGGFASVRDEICEDVTLARRIVEAGDEVGFFEAGDLVSVRMYPDWRATWRNWPRSLPMRDRYFGIGGIAGLLEVLLAQALPLPLLAALQYAAPGRAPRWAIAVNLILAAARIGVLFGAARAYVDRPWTYWLSPLADLPIAIRLIASAMRRQHAWRGRVVTRGSGRMAGTGHRVPDRSTVPGTSPIPILGGTP